MERPKLDKWFEETDRVLMEQGQVLDALKKAVEENSLDDQDVNQVAIGSLVITDAHLMDCLPPAIASGITKLKRV